MIYSINEGFFGGNKPNKTIVADVKAAEGRIESIIKYFRDDLKIVTMMKTAVCKDNFTDSDANTIKNCLQKLSDSEQEFLKEHNDRKLTVAVNNLIRKYCRTDVSDLQFSENTPDDYKALVKKVSANGQYTKDLTSIAHKFFKLNDDYTVMYKKRTDLSSEHAKACDEFGGMVGYAIGSIPVIKLGFGKADE